MKYIAKIFSFFAFLAVLMVTSCVKEESRLSVRVGGVFFLQSSVKISEGDSSALTATVFPADAADKSVSFASADSTVATVDRNGVVKGISAGRTTVTVTTNDGNHKDNCVLEVMPEFVHVASVSLNETSISINDGEDYTLMAKVLPDNATDKSVIWVSDDYTVATVSEEGEVTALRNGTATITVITVDSGKSASCTVKVAQTTGAVTGDASRISCSNAQLSGKLNIFGQIPVDLEYGILYSTSSDMPVESAIKIKGGSYDEKSHEFSVNAKTLEPETTYYYRAYFSTEGRTVLGCIKSFTTRPLSSMLKTEDAVYQSTTAVLNAVVDLTDCLYDNLEYGFEIVSEGGIGKDYKLKGSIARTFSTDIDGLSPRKKYTVSAFVTMDGHRYTAEGKSFVTVPEGAMNLGLSVHWGTCNVGASKPEETGGYYQWAGKRDVKSESIDVGLDNCPYHTGTASDKGWTKYRYRRDRLYPEDDVAQDQLKGNWRMPTDEEWKDLMRNCTFTSTTLKGVKGVTVTSNKKGYTDCSIFLPVTGIREHKECEYSSDCCYWSSVLYDYPEAAWHFSFSVNSGKPPYLRATVRYFAMPVRPVCSK